MNKLKKIQLFDVVNYAIITIITLLMIYPIINVIAISMSNNAGYIENPMMIFPPLDKISFGAYKMVAEDPLIWISYKNTIIITVVGVALSMLMYIVTAYPLSKSHLRGRKFFMKLVVFTMMFNGGIIPNYQLMRGLGLLDSLWSLIFSALFSGFNLILMKNFYESIPKSLEEAAKIDGGSEIYILFKIFIPLSKAIIATLALFTAVTYWNLYFSAMLYMRKPEGWTIQLVLREIIMGAQMKELSTQGNTAEIGTNLPSDALKYASIVITTVPILLVYPFVQKYFVTGVMVGAVKE